MFGHAWLAGGIPRTACVAAYEPICAVSLADSYINRANPGTYNATPGTAPTWAESTGWTFNGSSQYLTTGIVLSSQVSSALCRFSGYNAAANSYLFGRTDAGFNTFRVGWLASGTIRYQSNTIVEVSATVTEGVLGVSGLTAYRDGVREATDLAAGSAGGAAALFIAARNNVSPDQFYGGNIQALYIYNVPITPTQVRAVTDAMNMLPMRPSIRDGVMGKFGASKNAVRISPSRGGLL